MVLGFWSVRVGESAYFPPHPARLSTRTNTTPAPALTVDNLLSAREPLQRPDPALKLLVLRLHPLQRLTDPLHIPVRLVKPSSRVVFSSVIKVALLEDSGTSERKSLTVRIMCRNVGKKTLVRP